MANPTPYTRSYSFTNYQTANPTRPLPGLQVDNELENIELSLGGTITALADIRRSDGALVNGIVTVDSMSDEVRFGFSDALIEVAAEIDADRIATETARDVAISAAGAALSTFDSRAAATAANIPVSVAHVRTAGYTIPGDGGGGLYDKSLNQTPVAPGVLRFQDLNSVYWDLKDNEILYEQAGAKGDGTTDDWQAICDAHETGKVIRLGDGKSYVVSATVPVEGGGIIGSGKTRSIIKPNFNGTLYSVTAEDAVLFRDFKIDYATQRTSGAAILVDPGSGVENTHSVFEGLFILQANTGIDFRRASHFSLSKSTFGANTTSCVNIENQNHTDSGDSTIMSCSFLGSYSTNTAVLHKSSGGLKFIGNKILGVHSVGYRLDLAEGAETSILLFEGNSVENCTDVNIMLDGQVTTGSYNMISIIGNEIFGAPIGIQALGTHIGNLKIENNLIVVGVGAVFCQGVSIEGPAGFTVKNNTFVYGSATSMTCVGVGSTATYGEIGPNTYQTDIPLASRVASSSATTTLIKSTQTGQFATTTPNAVGPLYQLSAGVAQTYTLPFLEIPKVVASISNGSDGGGISCPVGGVSATAFLAKPIGFTNGGAVTVDWHATGFLG